MALLTDDPGKLRRGALLIGVTAPFWLYAAYVRRQAPVVAVTAVAMAVATVAFSAWMFRRAARLPGGPVAAAPSGRASPEQLRRQMPVAAVTAVGWLAVGGYLFSQGNVAGGVAGLVGAAGSGAVLAYAWRRSRG